MQPNRIQTLSIAFFVCLLAWGAFVTLAYLGVPIHAAVQLTDAGQQSAQQVCGAAQAGVGVYLCRGVVSIVPFLLHTAGRALPFLWYVVLCALFFGAFVGWRYARDGSTLLRVTWKPWKILLLFVLAIWLLFTVLSFGADSGRSTRQYFEPTSEAYNVGPEAMQALKADYDGLLARGCLTYQGDTAGGTKVYQLKVSCIQASFFTRVLPQLLVQLVLFFELLVLGRFLLLLLRVRTASFLLESLLSVALGACAWIAILWLLASLSIYTVLTGGILLIAVPALCYKQSLYWLERFWRHEWTTTEKWNSILFLLGWFLLSYLALNFLTVVRPFPIGWDDLGSYLNRPRLLVSYGHFIDSMSTFGWEYLTSLGFLMFGYNNPFGATASMMINWSAGVLAIMVVFGFSRLYLGRRRGLLAALLYYTLPLVGHFSFADMKVDNAVFFMGTIAVLTAFIALFPPQGEDEASLPEGQANPLFAGPSWALFALSGLFTGFAFSFKSTAVMVLLPLVGVVMGVLLQPIAFVGMLFFSGVILMQFGGFSLSTILARLSGTTVAGNTGALAFLLICTAAGVACIGYAIWNRRQALMPTVRAGALFAAGLAVAVGPWIIHNNILVGNVIPRFLLGAPNSISPTISLKGRSEVPDYGQDIRTLPPDLAVDTTNPACGATGSREELDRYWGFSNGWSHYLTLPWRSVMNVDAVGYYVTTMPALLLFPLLLLLPAFWMRRFRWLRWLFLFTSVVVVEWIFLANGIPWYGIGMFGGLVIGLEALVALAPDLQSKWAAAGLITLSLFSNVAFRLWQFEQQRNILEYSYGKVSASTLEWLTIPHYSDITQEVVRRHDAYPDRPYLYRVGTFISYFIPRNLEIIGLNDHQLDVFHCLYQEHDAALTLKRFKALGFNSIIFDTNTDTIEKDPNGSLHKKVSLFQQFVNTQSLGLQIVVNDPNAGVAFIEIP